MSTTWQRRMNPEVTWALTGCREDGRVAVDLFRQCLSNLTDELLHNRLDLLPHPIEFRSPEFIDLHSLPEAFDRSLPLAPVELALFCLRLVRRLTDRVRSAGDMESHVFLLISTGMPV